jgi:transcriptional regulator
VKTGRNITLLCENPARVRGESWEILEVECQTTTTTTTTTGSSVTAVWTPDRSYATADETEMKVTYSAVNLVVNSSPKLSSFTFMSIFVTVFSVTVL